MTTNEKVARRKLSLLELAKELNNVSKACKCSGLIIPDTVLGGTVATII
ncbi:hypothetical protein ACET99_13280 [Aeromonas caviae]